jgi:FKBP-type peptidyl-prolyl cis-trans isomerase SlyD
MPETIKANSVVSIDYTLRGDDGNVIDSSDGAEPLFYLHGHGNIVPGLEAALTGKASGDSLDVVVQPQDGYGARDPERVIDVPRDRMPEDLTPEVGQVIGMQTPGGHTIPLTIVSVAEETVKLDANHALAGETLHFSVTVREVRSATEEELAHGHVHGPGGAH